MTIPQPVIASGSIIYSEWMTTAVTVDGMWIAGEWDDAAEVHVTSGTAVEFEYYLYVKNDDSWIYVCLDVVGIVVYDDWDYASVGFDTGHDEVLTHGSEDTVYCYEHDVGHSCYNSIDEDWHDEHCISTAGVPFTDNGRDEAGTVAASGFVGTPNSDIYSLYHRIWEFKIPMALGDLNAYPGYTAGFWVEIYDDSADALSLWPPGWDWPYLSTWGDLVLASQPADSIIYSEWMTTAVTVDGMWIAGEWDDATEVHITSGVDVDFEYYMYVKNDGNWIYVCLDVVGDATLDDGDFCFFGFETGHDHVFTNGKEDALHISGTLTAGHYLHSTTTGGWHLHCSSTSGVPFTENGRDESGMVAAIGFAGSPNSDIYSLYHSIYEFKIPMSLGDLNAYPGYTAGIIVQIYDASGNAYSFWPTEVYWPDASTWGDIVLALGGDFTSIQDAIDAASDGDRIYVGSGTFLEDICIYKRLTILGVGDDSTFINGTGAGPVVTINASDVVFSGFTVQNGIDGIYLYDADRTIISNCTVYNCFDSGISSYSSNKISIIKCICHENGYCGIAIEDSCFAKIVDCVCYNHTFSAGVSLSYSDYVLIQNCICVYNDPGVDIYFSNFASICDSLFFWNYWAGLVVDNSEGLYVSTTDSSENYWGIDFYDSEGVVVSSYMEENHFNGISSEDSQVWIQYCSIEQNEELGIENDGSTIYAWDCWWGSASGPYHPVLNPSGTGDEVDDGIEFDPWQTELDQPSLLSDLRCKILRADEDTVYYVPTGNIYDDSAFYAFYAIAENPQVITSPTQSGTSDAYLDTDGSPLFTGDIVTFGGRFANRMVAYYEDAGLALIGFANNGTHRIFRRLSDGAHFYAVDSSTYNESEKDYFVFQIYTDGIRCILNVWGIRAPGTYAGGLCFINVIYPNMEDFTDSYFIFSWTDLNADGMPQPEEIALEKSGH